MAEDQSWFFINCLGFVTGIDYLTDIMPIDFEYVPAKSFPLIFVWLKWHNIFSVTINLNIIAVNQNS